MANVKDIGAALARQYDKLMAGAGLVLLVGTVAYLGIRLGGLGRDQAAFKAWMERMSPAHEQAQAVDVSRYRKAEHEIKHPEQIEGWTNALFVPETRVWCVECRQPIGYYELTCPFCLFKQPEEEEDRGDRDVDQDGMWDEWELQFKLNPTDPTDADKDLDDDGFTNLEEFRGRTHPRDPASHPPIGSKLILKEILMNPFNLLFKSVSTMTEAGDKMFAINTRDDGQTYFKKLGDQVEGFTLHKYDEVFVDEIRGNIPFRVNRSVLTLKDADKEIPLTMGEPRSYVELSAVLLFKMDDSERTVGEGDEFALLGKTYQVMQIDREKSVVVLSQLSDGSRVEITHAPADSAGSAGDVR